MNRHRVLLINIIGHDVFMVSQKLPINLFPQGLDRFENSHDSKNEKVLDLLRFLRLTV